jgi:hypothetical protein
MATTEPEGPAGWSPRRPRRAPNWLVAFARVLAGLAWAAPGVVLLWLAVDYLLGSGRGEPTISWGWVAMRVLLGLALLMLAYLVGVRRSRRAGAVGAALLALVACAVCVVLMYYLSWFPDERLQGLAWALVPAALALANWVARGERAIAGEAGLTPPH